MKTIHTYLPRTWAGISGQNLIDLCRCAHLKLSDAFQNEALLFSLLRVPMRYYMRINFAQKLDLLEQLQFLKSEPLISGWIMPRFIRVKWWIYSGPDKQLNHLTVEELATAHIHFNEYAHGKNIDALNRLCAVLYRPVSLWRWLKSVFMPCDLRQSFINAGSKAAMSGLYRPEHWREAVYINYRGVMKQWEADFPLIHTQRGDAEGGFGWPGIIHDMAGDKLGTVHQVEKMNARNLLFLMEKMEADRERSEQFKN